MLGVGCFNPQPLTRDGSTEGTGSTEDQGPDSSPASGGSASLDSDTHSTLALTQPCAVALPSASPKPPAGPPRKPRAQTGTRIRAEHLGLGLRTLYEKLKRLGIS